MIGKVLCAELMRLLHAHQPRVHKSVVDSQEIVDFQNSDIDDHIVSVRIIIDERKAVVNVILTNQLSDLNRFILSQFSIPFADPKCIDKVVDIVEHKKLQKSFISEYINEVGIDGITNILLKAALDNWLKEKGLSNLHQMYSDLLQQNGQPNIMIMNPEIWAQIGEPNG